MAVTKELQNVDYAKGQILNVLLQVLASAPGSPTEGQIYYNSTDETAYIRVSGSWLDLGVQGGSGLPVADTTAIVEGSVDNTKLVRIEADALTAATTRVINMPDTDVTLATPAELTKLGGIEALANVTDTDNVNAAGATMNADTDVSSNGWVLDEDNMASDDPTKVPTQQSVKAFVENAVTGSLTYQGGYNAATNTPDLDTSPSGVLIGDTYTVTAAGTFFTEEVSVGDMLIAEIDNPTVLGDWTRVEKNIPDIVDASETEKGLVEEATDAETAAGTATGGTGAKLFVSPAKLRTELGVTGSLNVATRYTEQIGDAAATTIVVTHNIGRQFLTAQIFETASTFNRVGCEIRMTSTTTTTFVFNTAPASNEYTVVITG